MRRHGNRLQLSGVGMTTIESPRAAERSTSSAEQWLAEFFEERTSTSSSDADGAWDRHAAWKSWVQHLEERRKLPVWPAALDGKRSPLWWSHSTGRRGADTASLLVQLDRIVMRGKRPRASVVDALRSWVDDRPNLTRDASAALEALAWCQVLPPLASETPADVWWRALDHLVRATHEADGMSPAESPLVHQLLAGELPLAMAYRFPELRTCRDLAERGERTLAAGLEELLDEAGMVHCCQLDDLVPLVGCWTRSFILSGRAFDDEVWPEVSRKRYAKVVRNLLRLTRRDGSWMFAPAEVATWRRDVLPVALRLAGDERDRAAAREALAPRAKVGGARARKLRDASLHAEEAGVALLRTSWSRRSELLSVAFGDEVVQTELVRGGDRFWSGTWGCQVALEGRPLRMQGDWQSVCWLADEEVSYLELEGEFENDITVQRQLVLARRHKFLLLADVVLGAAERNVSYEGRLPLLEGAELRTAEDSREVYISGCENDLLVLPLALSEWRSEPSPGTLERDDDALRLSHSATDGRLYAPLFIDLDARRSSKPCTWRRLTVAERRETLPPSVAAGFRVQVGKDQFMIYRSLGPTANRTLLGQNLISEFLVARFTREGTTDAIVEIE
ncbi:MAG: hypothetical protein KF708_00690 [Pirellulales bacterium]|nr:hypothetical protein [Pirellulales bacterium]